MSNAEPGMTPVLQKWTALLCLLVLSGSPWCHGATAPACDEPNFLLRRFPVGPMLTSAVVADFNGDGKPDVAVSGFRQNVPGIIGYVYVLLGQGDGSLRVMTNYSLSSFSAVTTRIAAGDLNNDGKMDLARVLESSNAILVWLGNGDGTLQSSSQYFASRPSNILPGVFSSPQRWRTSTPMEYLIWQSVAVQASTYSRVAGMEHLSPSSSRPWEAMPLPCALEILIEMVSRTSFSVILMAPSTSFSIIAERSRTLQPSVVTIRSRFRGPTLSLTTFSNPPPRLNRQVGNPSP
jgi:hypothetical protein